MKEATAYPEGKLLRSYPSLTVSMHLQEPCPLLPVPGKSGLVINHMYCISENYSARRK